MDIADIERRKQELAKQMEDTQRLLAAYAVVEADLRAGNQSANAKPAPSTEAASPQPRDRFAPNPAMHVEAKVISNPAVPAGFTQAVRDSLQFMPVNFTLNDVEAHLKQQGVEVPRVNISFVLSRFQRAGVITMLERGTGKKAGVYSLPTSAGSNQP